MSKVAAHNLKQVEAICDILGIESTSVTKLVFHFEVGYIPTVEIRRYVSPTEAGDIELVMSYLEARDFDQ